MPTYGLDLTFLGSIARVRGIGRYAYGLAKALAGQSLEANEQIHVLLDANGPFINLGDLDLSKHETAPPESQPTFSRFLSQRKQTFAEVLDRSQVDTLHFVAGVGVLPTPATTKSIVTCHDLIPLRLPHVYNKGRWLKQAKTWFKTYRTYRSAHRIIAISEATKSDLQSLLRMPFTKIGAKVDTKIDRVYQGIDHDAFHPTPQPGESTTLFDKYGIASPYVVFVGDHDPRKGVPMLVQTYRDVYEKSKVPLVLAGCPKEQLRDETRQIIESMPKNSVKIVGFMDSSDIPALYRNATLHVFPSMYEGFGLTIAEAMASGCPVLTTPISSLPEVGGHAVAYGPADDAGAFAIKILELIQNQEQLTRLRELGLKQAKQFSWQKCAQETLQVYRRVAEGAPQ